MYFKVRCLREPIRILISIAAFFCPFWLLQSVSKAILERLFSLEADGWLTYALALVGAAGAELLCQAVLRLYKVYEFTEREIRILLWYGGWDFYFNALAKKVSPPRKKLYGHSVSPLRPPEPEAYRGYPDEFEPEQISEALSHGASPDSVLGTGKLLKTLSKRELRDVKLLKTPIGATLLLSLLDCGPFSERFLWQHRLHNRGKLFVIHLSWERGAEAFSLIQAYLGR